MRPARLAIAMIVRDEAELAFRFLASVRGLWDELVVVDTGSTDGTPALFEAEGATVVHRPWDDDFAAARNFGLQRVTADWVLFLDADEFVSPEFAAELREVLADDGAGAATVTMVNELPHGHQRVARLLRLFRRDEAVRFQSPIHEDVSQSVQAMLRRTGRACRHVTAPVQHTGYTRARAAAKDKKARDLRILQACLAKAPGDLYSHFKVLELARFYGDEALAASAAPQALAALSASAPGAVRALHFGGELVALVADGLHPKRPKQALAVLEAWAPRLSPSPAFLLRRGELREVTGDLVGACADFEACRDRGDALGDVQRATVRPCMGLARVALAKGDVPATQRYCDEALRLNARDPEALLLTATLAVVLQGPTGLAAFQQRHQARTGPCDELAQAVAEAARLTAPAPRAAARRG